MKSHSVLLLSNGHGEDTINCQILKALKAACSDIDVSAVPIVGDGSAYRRSGVPVVGPTSKMPSGGVFYMNPLLLVKDIWAGLIALTWQQLRAVRQHSRRCDLVVATGDIVAAASASFTDRPYVIFLSAHSSYMDDLISTGKDLRLIPGVRTIALLPGSRLPEANNNLVLLLQLVKEIAVVASQPVQFRAALVPSLMAELGDIAARSGWLHLDRKLVYQKIKLFFCLLPSKVLYSGN